MTPEAQQLAILEACGWSRLSESETIWTKAGPRGFEEHHRMFANPPPDYLNDLNAIRDAVKDLPIAKQWLWFAMLATNADEDSPAALSGADKWSEVFLRTIGKWVE